MMQVIFRPYLVVITTYLFTIDLAGQLTNGYIEYDRKYYWLNVSSKFDFTRQEDIDRDRLTWGSGDNEFWSQKYDLYLEGNKSMYTEQPDENNYGYSWKDDDYIIIRDYDDKTAKDFVTFYDKTYLIEGDMPKYKWKILNEIKEIAGYLCMKAETYDPIKEVPVYAWFTDKIPFYGGPEGYGGLPGMILGLDINGDDVIIEATKINLEEPQSWPKLKKIKSKKIDREEYHKKVKKSIKESLEGKKNPYWQVRY